MRRSAFFALLCALGAAACGDNNVTTPTPSVPITVTDTFSGVLTPNGATSYPFVTASSGDIRAIISVLKPDATLVVGLSLGTWNGAACQVILSNDKAGLASGVSGTASGSGSLCARIYDVGNVTTPSTYEIQVVHP
jgi:hypothetical protein